MGPKDIIARSSTLLFEYGTNIEDVQQKVVGGTFVMPMLADVSGAKVDLAGLHKVPEDCGAAMGLTVMEHDEAVIKAMHRV